MVKIPYTSVNLKSYLKILWAVLLTGFCFSLNGAHLVGGEISYECLGGNNYRVKLRIYRDCAGGGAAFDALVAIAVYDSSGTLIANMTAQKGPTIKVNSNTTGNPCVTPPPGLCTEYAEYVDTIFLPPISGGYVLTHQRCCRNAAISNVNNSGNFGNTYTVSIPPNDSSCNSSPQYITPAPIVLCVNSNFSIQMDVTEADGDSLYFELCDVLAGGGSGGGIGCAAVTPNPPCPPPYTPVPFTPPLTSTNPMPSTPQISIDSQTGLLKARPSQAGRFLVGICVLEYRDGIPLSRVRLDYQFNVTNCINNIVSDMVTPIEDPDILCDGLTVHFTSESQNASKVLWDFGDPTSVTDTSTDPNPSYSYTIPGFYRVTLIAEPGSPCGDTVSTVFQVRNPLLPVFTYDGIFCFEAQNVIFTPQGFYPPTATFEWDFGSTANFPVVQSKVPPPITWSLPGKHYVTLSVTDNGCTETALDSLEISNLSVGVDAGPDQSIQRGQTINLQATGGTDYYWSSDNPVDFSNPWGRSTSAKLRVDADTVKFYVRVTDPLGCAGIDSLLVYIKDGGGPINFITPNGDGKNDLFDLSDLNPDQDCDISIQNRWGSVVFRQKNYNNSWRGINLGGDDLPDGTYYYILTRNGELVWQDAITIMRN